MSASYPGAVKSFATRSPGQTIASAHIDDLQDEVNAIEAGLLNGTAPLNSSNSTLATLSVPGLVKFGTVPYTMPSSGPSTGQVLTCVSTNGSTAGLEWRTPAAKAYGQLWQQSTQSITNDTWMALNFDVEDVNVGPVHSTSVNSSRITFANSTGIFLLTARCSFSTLAGDANPHGIRFLLNDTTIIAQMFCYSTSAGTDLRRDTPTITQIVRVASTGDYYCVQVYQNTGGPLQTPFSTSATGGWRNSVGVFQIA